VAGEPTLEAALARARQALAAERDARAEEGRVRARLEARRARLLEERERLRGEGPSRVPRLPADLAPPFEVRGPRHRRPRLRLVLPVLAACAALLVTGRDESPFLQLGSHLFIGVLAAACGAIYFFPGPRWRITAEGLGPRSLRSLFWPPEVDFRAVRAVEVSVTDAQRRLGVGTVLVLHRKWAGAPAPQERALTLTDVPEPERLAAWLRAQVPVRKG
jgi:hypothetical protein